MNELNFYKDELKTFEQHLEELVSKNTKQKVTAQIEHFQNCFIRQREVMDELKHQLHEQEQLLTHYGQQVSGMGLSYIKMDNHKDLREEMDTFRKINIELKNSFRRFESEWM